MDWVLVKDTCTSIWAGDKFTAMVTHNSNSITDTRKDTLTTAGETSEEMCFNETFSYKKRSVVSNFINDTVRTGRKITYLNILRWVMGIVDNDVVFEFFIKCIAELAS